MLNFKSAAQLVVFLGFAASGLTAWVFLLKAADERRGRQLTTMRLLLFPFFIAHESFTERGQRLYARFQLAYGFTLGFWLLALLTTAF